LSCASASNTQRLSTTTNCFVSGKRVYLSKNQRYENLVYVFSLLFYTAIVKSRGQHVVQLGMDGTNLKLLFTTKPMNDIENVHYLRPLLTIDRINHNLYFYNGFDKIFTLNLHGEILHIQYQTTYRFHSFKIFSGK
jgi:hypothetical protein